MKEYTIQSGDSFFRLAKQKECCWQDFIEVNPGIDPCCLQVGQRIRLPLTAVSKPSGGCAELLGQGNTIKRCDDVIVEVEGVKFRVTRMGEPSVPHEVHLILPRTEIHKIEHPGNGIVETTIMLSNINIVNSPRFEGEGSEKSLPEKNQKQISMTAASQTGMNQTGMNQIGMNQIGTSQIRINQTGMN